MKVDYSLYVNHIIADNMEKIQHSLLTIGRDQEEIWSRVKETGVVGIIDSYNELIYLLFDCCQLKFLIYSHLNMQLVFLLVPSWLIAMTFMPLFELADAHSEASTTISVT